MKLSVIIPVYNVEKYIKQCVESVLLLNNKIECEIIFVNDGSTDSSLDILQSYSNRYNFIIYNQENKGLSAARNVGLSLASGEYVAFIDSDDYIDDGLIKVLDIACSTKCDIVIGDYVSFSDENFTITDEFKHSIVANTNISYLGTTFFTTNYKALQSVVWRNLYRRDFLKDNKLFFHEGVYFEDVEFTPIAMCTAHTVVYSGISFYHYRKRNNSITTSNSTERKIHDSILVWKNLVEYSNSSRNFKIQSIFRELGMYAFFNQYSFYSSVLTQKLLFQAKELAKYKIKFGKFEILRLLFLILPNNTFFNILKRLR